MSLSIEPAAEPAAEQFLPPPHPFADNFFNALDQLNRIKDQPAADLCVRCLKNDAVRFSQTYIVSDVEKELNGTFELDNSGDECKILFKWSEGFPDEVLNVEDFLIRIASFTTGITRRHTKPAFKVNDEDESKYQALLKCIYDTGGGKR